MKINCCHSPLALAAAASTTITILPPSPVILLVTTTKQEGKAEAPVHSMVAFLPRYYYHHSPIRGQI